MRGCMPQESKAPAVLCSSGTAALCSPLSRHVHAAAACTASSM